MKRAAPPPRRPRHDPQRATISRTLCSQTIREREATDPALFWALHQFFGPQLAARMIYETHGERSRKVSRQ